MRDSNRRCLLPFRAAWPVLLLWALALGPADGLAQYRDQGDAQPRLVAEDYSSLLEAQKPPITVEHYVLEAELVPDAHEIRAKAQIRFRASENLTSVELELNKNLFPTNVTGEGGEALSARRGADDLILEVWLNQPLTKDQTTTISFEYEGKLESPDFSPVEGVELAYVGEEGSYLLYPARWFPLSGYAVNRHTAELHITVPSGYQVVSGGKAQPPEPQGENVRYSFTFDQPQFPGSIAVFNQEPQVVQAEGLTLKVYFSPERRAMAQAYGEAAARMVSFFRDKFGPPPVADLSIVEISDRSLGGYAGQQVIFLASRAIGSEVNVRLLAQEVAQQWWRGLVSPASRADLWLDHGLATYSEALYLEHMGGTDALEERIREMSIDALTHDTIPIHAAGRMEEFSLPYKTILYDKAGVVLHMLRWIIGDEAFFQALRQFAERFAFRSATTEEFAEVVKQTSSQDLGPFFIQWMDSTGASDFQLEYVIYRVPDGFKIVGTVQQDMDLFSMPVEIQVETDGEPVTQRVQVSGKSAEFAITTADRPRKLVVDPNQRVLRYNDAIRLRVAVARGEQAVQRHDYSAALEEFQKALDNNPLSSLAHYRVGEVFFLLRNYQSAANAFREVLNGDLEPKWTEVWSHLYLGKIFDVTGQRERAINEYQQAVRTKDDTQGALEEANKYLQEPYYLGGGVSESPG